MTNRFLLRFTSGEREGESVPLSAPRSTLGRRPGNTLQVQDGSISGQHAEFLIEGARVTLRDLDSTNGTRVGGARITEQALAHGDRLAFGSVEGVFVDEEFAGDAGRRPAQSSDVGASGEDAVERISADKLERSGKRSRAGLLFGLLILVVGGGAAGYLLTSGGGGGGRRLEPPRVVEGNLIQGGDFEGEDLGPGWVVEELGAADFAQHGGARATGRDGLRASLDAGELARVRGPELSTSPGRRLRVAASLRARGESLARVGLELLAGGDESSVTTAWSEAVVEVTQHQRVELVVPILPGVRGARIVVEARAGEGEGGTVDVDDVSVVSEGGNATPTAKVGEFTLWALGQPAQEVALYKISKPLLSGIAGVAQGANRLPTLEVEQATGGVEIRIQDAAGMRLVVEPAALTGGLASLGSGGYLEHGSVFERDGATALLCGQGKDLLALRFDAPVRLSGRPTQGGALIELPGVTSCRVQLDFDADRARAGDLAYAARKAESEGRLGECMSAWGELLSAEPFDEDLIREAREARARLEQAGLVELGEVETSFERARFFRLLDLFRLCRDNAESVGLRYEGTPVAARAAELGREIEASLGSLEADLDRDEIERLGAIRRVLEASQSPRLAAAVRDYLAIEYGVEN